jgi:hypothetical protein
VSRVERRPWKVELAEGFRWLWSHDLLRTLAIVLGLLNMLGTMSTATFVLFGQEVLDTSPTEFAILGTSGAVGGIVGGWTASAVARRIGVGPSLALTLLGGGAVTITIGLMSWWPAVWLLLGAFMFTAVLWNVITVSFRQTVIPDHLLGRVNSVYRFFGWGMMPVGAALGGLIVVLGEQVASREVAQRLPWLIAGRHDDRAVRLRRPAPHDREVRRGPRCSTRPVRPRLIHNGHGTLRRPRLRPRQAPRHPDHAQVRCTTAVVEHRVRRRRRRRDPRSRSPTVGPRRPTCAAIREHRST